MGAGDLAELLRELKERSGLSYGALAKRLHVSTSTLHRYVSGSAVPTEFAPLERFARVCGASRQEMVEVHRRWILADASRGERERDRDRDRDRKDPEPSPGEASGDAAGPSRGGAVSGGLASGGAASGAPAAGGVNPGAPARSESAAADPGAGDPRNGGSQGTDSRDGGLREPNLGDESPQNGDPRDGTPRNATPRDATPRNATSPGADPKDEAPGIVIGSAPVAAARREGRRLPRARVLVAAGVVLALGATAVAVQAASGGGDSNQVATDSPSADDGKREGGPDGPGSASPSAKESGKGKPDKEAKPSGEPDGDGKGKDKGKGSGDEPSAPAAGGGGEGGGAGGAAPVTVSTQAHYWQDPCGHPYLVDKEPGALSPPPNEQDAPGWASANGAVSARDQTVKLVVQGKGDDTVVLESLNVRVAGTGAPLAWNNYKMGYLGVGCGGNVPKHTFDVNLDASVPRPTPQSGDDNFPYKVSASDPEAFYVEATANTRYVRWYLELEWSSGGRSGTVRIDDTGKPFATSGDKSRPVYGYSLDTKKWTKTNRDNDNVSEPAA
ncbi:helix-turn-helix domain-containing protein [Streptomyces sp. NPDC046853]|uniref:transcriptional regulator n=1 Tax=Streptomyces sp. NPDC046853 TaxID=3154920 RepID=UPI0033EE4DB1